MKERFIKKFGEVNGLVPHFSTINSFCLSVIKTWRPGKAHYDS